MPENETPISDPRTASRWRPLRERLDRGDLPIDLFPEIQREFYNCLRAVYRQWRACGVDPARLFAATVADREALHRLVHEARRHDYAQLLRDVVASERNADLGRVIRCWLDLAWDYARTQLQVDRHGEGRHGDFSGRVGRMLDHLACGLVEDPSRIPRRPSRAKPPILDELLGLDLLQEVSAR
jgi:hypothetical protein